jgi:hypothetical protein
MLSMVVHDGAALEHAADGIQSNEEIVLAAIGQTGTALQFAAREVSE